MAFTGSATVKKVSDRMYRITGLSLGIGANGTIGLAGGTGDVDITDAPDWGKYGSVTLQDSVSVLIMLVSGATVAPAVGVAKTGTTQDDFLITLTNLGAAATGTLEFYVEFH